MPISSNAFQKTTGGSDFYSMVLTADAKQFLYGTYMGGPNSRTHVDGGTSRLTKRESSTMPFAPAARRIMLPDTPHPISQPLPRHIAVSITVGTATMPLSNSIYRRF